ncbi:2-succinyl-5-enolpyruvyl-6-hydroxy-3-cyclohexene-1-carboxylate synthase [Alkalibacillus flavidus]|uniref:2-succinyl-5-enolpyruvyl-6-hydroxy-3-cyclohexene-1-carboxylate synthase n=1 Tax=Alkalibacillus flavidus TaxID=546021 RepID=A0ABV2KYI4_9BACI
MDTMANETYYVSYFIDELYQNGLTDVVITPGSRSTPLSMLFTDHPSIEEWIHFDERSAAFFALGIAKTTQRPVALVCTSGTAAANYYPAIVEAYYSRVPLLVLTADRPNELRDNGAPQAIDQIKMYGDYVKHYHDMALPSADEQLLQYSRRQASRAYTIANAARKGPVHYNFPFRDPLTPDLERPNLWGESESPYIASIGGYEGITQEDVRQVVGQVQELSRGLIVCGELTSDDEARAVLSLARQWQIPVLADVLSRLRQIGDEDPLVITTYDALLKHESFQHKMAPDFVIRFGSMPVSKPYFQWMAKVQPSVHFVVDEQAGYRDHSNVPSTMIYSCIELLIESLTAYSIDQDQAWVELWQSIDQQAKHQLKELASDSLTEGSVAHVLSQSVNDQQVIFVGSSMPIRDMDTFFLPEAKQVTVLANRGANGIDGVVSSALGAAAAGEDVTLLIGDLSFLHDYTTLLMAKKHNLRLRIVVINNNGGGIFNFLPQYQYDRHFEAVFGTPFDAPIGDMVKTLGMTYHFVESNEALGTILQQPISDLEVAEVQTERETNYAWHQQLKSMIASILKGDSHVRDSRK